MKIVINHLTRMKPGYVCIAGIDPTTGAHVRPVTGARLSDKLLAGNGGPFDIASLVDLGVTKSAAKKPEVEDQAFNPANAKTESDLSAAAFWQLLKQVAKPKLGDLFGADLQARSKGATVDVGKGIASLGCLVPTSVSLEVNRYGDLRARVEDGTFSVDLSVTDIRLYDGDHETPDEDSVADVESRLRKKVGVILSVGLTRSFPTKNDPTPRHWLQLNNVHLEDDPDWKLG